MHKPACDTHSPLYSNTYTYTFVEQRQNNIDQHNIDNGAAAVYIK